jgi:hypothetical protein
MPASRPMRLDTDNFQAMSYQMSISPPSNDYCMKADVHPYFEV